MNREPLPSVARHGRSMLEKKLLSYMAWRQRYRFEWRVSDGLNFDPTLMPRLIGNFEFVPLFEVGVRIFMFENKVDRATAVRFYYDMQPERKTRAPRKSKRPRRQRSRKPRK